MLFSKTVAGEPCAYPGNGLQLLYEFSHLLILRTVKLTINLYQWLRKFSVLNFSNHKIFVVINLLST